MEPQVLSLLLPHPMTSLCQALGHAGYRSHPGVDKSCSTKFPDGFAEVHPKIIIRTTSPNWCGSVDWAPHWEAKGCGSIPSRSICLGYRPGPQLGVCERQPHIHVSLPLFLLPFPSLKKKKQHHQKKNKEGEPQGLVQPQHWPRGKKWLWWLPQKIKPRWVLQTFLLENITVNRLGPTQHAHTGIICSKVKHFSFILLVTRWHLSNWRIVSFFSSKTTSLSISLTISSSLIMLSL